MIFKLYNLLIIAAVISCSKAVEERAAFDGCLETYLELKVKFPKESTFEKTAPGCKYIAGIMEELQKEPVDLTDTNKCILKEMEGTPFMIYIVPLQVKLLQRGMMESSELALLPDLFTYLMKYNWISAALKCVKNEEINGIFDAAGIRNVMISTPEEKLCFIKYAQEKGFFQYDNPNKLSNTDYNCSAIVEMKREQFSDGKFIPHFMFRYRSIWNVVNDPQLYMETKTMDAEVTLFKNKFIDRLLKAVTGWANSSEDN